MLSVYLVTTLVFIILVLFYSMIRNFTYFDILPAFFILTFGVLIFAVSICFSNFYFINFIALLMLNSIILLQNPLNVIKWIMIMTIYGLITSLLEFTIFFNYWKTNTSISPFFLLLAFILLLAFEKRVQFFSRLFDSSPVNSVQLSAVIIPASVTLQLFLEVNRNPIYTIITSLIIIIVLNILIFAFQEALVLKKYTVVHHAFYLSLIDDFTELMESDYTSRKLILNSITNEDGTINALLKHELDGYLTKRFQNVSSDDPYLYISLYGLVRTVPSLNITVNIKSTDYNVPYLAAWIEITVRLLTDEWSLTPLYIAKMNNSSEFIFTLKPDNPKNIKLQTLLAPSPHQFPSLLFESDSSVYLTQHFLTLELGLSSRIHYTPDALQIIYTRKYKS